MPHYALRVFDDVPESVMIQDYVSSQSSYLMIRHDVDKDDARSHWHASFYSSLTQDGVRKKITRMLLSGSSKGNRVYSLKQMNDKLDVYDRYMCHAKFKGDHVQLIKCQGLTYNQEWCQKQNEIYWDSQETFKKDKKAQKVDTIQELLSRCKASDIHTRYHIAEELVLMFIEQARPMNVFYMKGVVNTVNMTLDGVKGDDGRYLIEKISEL